MSLDISHNLASIQQSLTAEVLLVAVTKTKPLADLRAAYDAGQREMAENKVQEILEKAPQLPSDIHWHLIGHLQTNKVKQVLPFVHLIQSVDSLKLLLAIEKHAEKIGKPINCLLQVFIAQEETKFGLDPAEVKSLLNSPERKNCKWVNIIGLMGMASNTSNQEQVKAEFQSLKQLFDQTKAAEPQFEWLSMGMSGDYELAVAAGSNLVRIGSKIFGPRIVNNPSSAEKIK